MEDQLELEAQIQQEHGGHERLRRRGSRAFVQKRPPRSQGAELQAPLTADPRPPGQSQSRRLAPDRLRPRVRSPRSPRPCAPRAGAAFAGLHHARSRGGSPNADPISDLYKIIARHRGDRLRRRRGRADLVASSSSGRARAPVAAQIHGNTTPRDRLDRRRRAHPRRARRRHLHRSAAINNPPNTRPRRPPGLEPARRLAPTSAKPPNGKALQHLRRPAASTSGATRTPAASPTRWADLRLRGDGRAGRHHGRRSTSSRPDVNHSWWIPKLGGKFDAVPGYTTTPGSRSPKPGVYRGQCAELCGRNHADMTARGPRRDRRPSTRRGSTARSRSSTRPTSARPLSVAARSAAETLDAR